jgi:nucleotide-binding universal stress UspA family protein
MRVVPDAGRLFAGTSGSPCSRVGLRYARDVGRRYDVVLLVVRGWILPEGDLAERRCHSRYLSGLWAGAARQQLSDALDAVWSVVPPNLDLQPVVIRGEPGPALVEIADCGNDLLVVGAGRGRKPTADVAQQGGQSRLEAAEPACCRRALVRNGGSPMITPSVSGYRFGL